MKQVLIVGGGWSGLSVAIWLALHQYQPILLERAPQLGGRARGIETPAFIIDNGQHLLIQGYTAFLELCTLLQLEDQALFLKKSPEWNVVLPSSYPKKLRFKNPFSLLPFCTLPEMLSFMRFVQLIKKEKIALSFKTAHALLEARQPLTLYTLVWEPLCLALFSTPPKKLCVKRFVATLSHILSQDNSHFLFTKKDLSTLFVQPAADWLKQKGGIIHLRQGVEQLIIQNDQCIGVQTHTETFFAEHCILATPPWTAHTLLKKNAPSISEKLAHFLPTTITTVYLQYAPETALSNPLTSLIGCHAQWIFDKSFTGQAGLFAAILIEEAKTLSLTTEALVAILEQELEQHLHFPKHARTTKVIREKRAAFQCRPNLPEMSPRTPIQGLWLCGDYLHPFYPASLESAVNSGKNCAHLIVEA